MLTPELVAALQAPISEASPAGGDLSSDPAFAALETAAQGKPEQQFGDKIIPAVEPEWRTVSEEAEALLRRSKDVRLSMMVLRAATRLQGVTGFDLGMQLLTGLLETFWDVIHPELDAEEDDDPTMRLNALSALATKPNEMAVMVRDLYEASVGVSRGVGPIRVRDIAIAHNLLKPVGSGTVYSPAQVQGALTEIHGEHPEILQILIGMPAQVARLQTLLVERTGLGDALDLDALRRVGAVLRTAALAVTGDPAEAAAAETTGGDAAGAGAAPGARPAVPPGEIGSRQDALLTLDRVIRFLQQTEPGNPAPLLIERAKRLIGVSFFDIIADLAPNALDSIETVTGPRPSE